MGEELVGKALKIETVKEGIVEYLRSCQKEEGPFKGAFFSPYALHHPINDFRAGGAHHPEVAALTAWAFSFLGSKWSDEDLLRRSESALNWVSSMQTKDGGFYEIQNLDLPARWYEDDLDHADKPFPCSTFVTSKVIFGLSQAVRKGTSGSEEFLRSLHRAVEWQLSMEYPSGSGSFSPREGTPVDCLYADVLVSQALASAAKLKQEAGDSPPSEWLEALRRAVEHVVSLQEEGGRFPYLSGGGKTVAYTAAVAWCLQNTLSLIGGDIGGTKEAIRQACRFLLSRLDLESGALDLSDEATNMRLLTVPYFLLYSTLKRSGEVEAEAAEKVLRFAHERFWNPVRRLFSVANIQRGGIYDCAQFQAEILLYLLTAEEGEAV